MLNGFAYMSGCIVIATCWLCVLSVSLLNFLWCILLHTGCQCKDTFLNFKQIPFLEIKVFFRAGWGRTGVECLQLPKHSTRGRVIIYHKHWCTEAVISKGGLFHTFLLGCFTHKSGVKCVLYVARFYRAHRLVSDLSLMSGGAVHFLTFIFKCNTFEPYILKWICLCFNLTYLILSIYVRNMLWARLTTSTVTAYLFTPLQFARLTECLT